MKHVKASTHDSISIEDRTMDIEKDQNSDDIPTPIAKVDKKNFQE